VGQEQITHLREQLKHLRESGEEKLSTTDPDARFCESAALVLGYTAEVAVSGPFHRGAAGDAEQER